MIAWDELKRVPWLNRACTYRDKPVILIGIVVSTEDCLIDYAPYKKESELKYVNHKKLDFAELNMDNAAEVVIDDETEFWKPFFDKDVPYFADGWSFLFDFKAIKYAPRFIRVEDKFGITRFVESKKIKPCSLIANAEIQILERTLKEIS